MVMYACVNISVEQQNRLVNRILLLLSSAAMILMTHKVIAQQIHVFSRKYAEIHFLTKFDNNQA